METHIPNREQALSLLKEYNSNESLIKHVLASDIEPQTDLERTLYAIDELTGLVTACALVRPSKSVSDMKAKSVRKKWKEKSFAAGVNRTVIEKGAEMLGVELNDLISDVIMGMREVADAIGL